MTGGSTDGTVERGAPAPDTAGPARGGDSFTRRHAEAVRARRAELREDLGALAAGHRARLRSELVKVRLDAERELATALAALRAAALPWLPRAELPGLLAPALEREVAEVVGGAALAAGAAVRRVAGRLLGPHPLPAELLGGPGWVPPEPALPPPPPPVRLPEALLRSSGAVRPLVGLAAVAPALGLTVAGGRTVLPLALGIAVAAVAWLARRQRTAVARERWTRWLDRALADGGAAARASLTTRLLDAEQEAGEVLDRARTARHTDLTSELTALGGPHAR